MSHRLLIVNGRQPRDHLTSEYCSRMNETRGNRNNNISLFPRSLLHGRNESASATPSYRRRISLQKWNICQLQKKSASEFQYLTVSNCKLQNNQQLNSHSWFSYRKISNWLWIPIANLNCRPSLFWLASAATVSESNNRLVWLDSHLLVPFLTATPRIIVNIWHDPNLLERRREDSTFPGPTVSRVVAQNFPHVTF